MIARFMSFYKPGVTELPLKKAKTSSERYTKEFVAITPRQGLQSVRPTGSTWELENLSYGAEELCYSSFFPDLCHTYLELSAVMPVQCCLNRIEP